MAGQLDRIEVTVFDAAIPGGAEELGQRVIYAQVAYLIVKGRRLHGFIAS